MANNFGFIRDLGLTCFLALFSIMSPGLQGNSGAFPSGSAQLRPAFTTSIAASGASLLEEWGNFAFKELPEDLEPAGIANASKVPRKPIRPIPSLTQPLASAPGLSLVVKKNARQQGVDEKLVLAVMRQESGFNPRAVSPKGAMGLMQLMPDTAALLGVADPFDVEQNISGGIKYLKRCLKQFHGNICLALAAYNAGPDNVLKYQGIPPFPETRNYVAAVMRDYAGAVPPKREGITFKNTSNPEISPSNQDCGLQWRVPTPQWKIARPQLKVQAPKWKSNGRSS